MTFAMSHMLSHFLGFLNNKTRREKKSTQKQTTTTTSKISKTKQQHNPGNGQQFVGVRTLYASERNMYANYNNHIGFMRFYFLASVAGSAFHTNFAGVVADASSYDNGISMADFTYEGAACCSLNFKNCTEDGWCGESKEACEQTCPSPSKLIWFEDGPLVIDEANGDLDCLERWKTCNNSALDGTDYLGTDVCCPGLVCYEKNPYYSQCMHPADLNCSDILAAGDVAIIGLNSDNPDEVLLVALEDLPSGLELFLTDNAWMGNSFRNGDFYPDYDGTIKVSTISYMVHSSSSSSPSEACRLPLLSVLLSPTSLFATPVNDIFGVDFFLNCFILLTPLPLFPFLFTNGITTNNKSLKNVTFLFVAVHCSLRWSPERDSFRLR